AGGNGKGGGKEGGEPGDDHRREPMANVARHGIPLEVETYLRRGSSASRSPSPKRLKPRTVTKIASPGKSASQALAWMNATLALRSQPQLGVGGCVPRPRKLSVASTMIDVAMPSVVVTMIGARQFGKTCRNK